MDQYNFYINKQYLMKNQAAIFLNEQNNRYKNILQDERILAQSMSLYIDMTGRSSSRRATTSKPSCCPIMELNDR